MTEEVGPPEVVVEEPDAGDLVVVEAAILVAIEGALAVLVARMVNDLGVEPISFGNAVGWVIFFVASLVVALLKA